MVGLAISTLSKTERMAVMILPIALLLQVLLSRVVFGHTTQWDGEVLMPPGTQIQAPAQPTGAGRGPAHFARLHRRSIHS